MQKELQAPQTNQCGTKTLCESLHECWFTGVALCRTSLHGLTREFGSPGSTWTDPLTGQSSPVPGSGLFAKQGRNPYDDFVSLAKDLQVAGIDLDYEEFWHADRFKIGSAPGPWELPQTVYKYSAIVRNLMTSIQTNYPTCKLSTAAAAVGAWSGSWWGGNLKGVWLQSKQLYPDLIDFLTTGANAGGINVMT